MVLPLALLTVAVAQAPGWVPQPGDVIQSTPRRPQAWLIYAATLGGPPGHVGVVVCLPDGGLAVAEAGGDGVAFTRLTPLAERLAGYAGGLWVRPRCVPLTPDQSARLTAFAQAADASRYALGRAVAHGAGLRARGPLRTAYLGRPQGLRDHFLCGEFVVEALVAAGAVDAETARPAATYPHDLLADRSANRHIAAHPPLATGGWGPAIPLTASASAAR